LSRVALGALCINTQPAFPYNSSSKNTCMLLHQEGQPLANLQGCSREQEEAKRKLAAEREFNERFVMGGGAFLSPHSVSWIPSMDFSWLHPQRYASMRRWGDPGERHRDGFHHDPVANFTDNDVLEPVFIIFFRVIPTIVGPPALCSQEG
jgi:hypothetical protein